MATAARRVAGGDEAKLGLARGFRLRVPRGMLSILNSVAIILAQPSPPLCVSRGYQPVTEF